MTDTTTFNGRRGPRPGPERPWRIDLRLSTTELAALDEVRGKHSRSECLRYLIEHALEQLAADPRAS